MLRSPMMLCFFLRNMRWSRFLTEDDKRRRKIIRFFIQLFLFLSTALYQKRYNRDRKYRFKLQKQIEEEYEKHSRLEEILKTSGTTDSLKSFAGKPSTCKTLIGLFHLHPCLPDFMGDNNKILSSARKISAADRSDCESDDKMSNSTASTDTKDDKISSPKSN